MNSRPSLHAGNEGRRPPVVPVGASACGKGPRPGLPARRSAGAGTGPQSRPPTIFRRRPLTPCDRSRGDPEPPGFAARSKMPGARHPPRCCGPCTHRAGAMGTPTAGATPCPCTGNAAKPSALTPGRVAWGSPGWWSAARKRSALCCCSSRLPTTCCAALACDVPRRLRQSEVVNKILCSMNDISVPSALGVIYRCPQTNCPASHAVFAHPRRPHATPPSPPK